MELQVKVLKDEYTTQRLPDKLIETFLEFASFIETSLDLKFRINKSDNDTNWIAINSKEVAITLSSVESLKVYELRIKITDLAIKPIILKSVSEKFEYYSLEEILKKVEDENGINRRYLAILKDVSINGEIVDNKVVDIYSIAIRSADLEVRANIPWYIYDNPHYWLACIDFYLEAVQKEQEERVRTSLLGALEMIIKGFLEDKISPFYNDDIFDNAFEGLNKDFNAIVKNILDIGGGYDEVIEYIIKAALLSSVTSLRVNGMWSVYYLGKNYKTIFWDKFVPIISQLLNDEKDEDVKLNGRTMLNWIDSNFPL